MNRSKTLLCTLVSLVIAFSATLAWADLNEVKVRGEIRHIGIRYANFVTGAGDGFEVDLVKGFAKSIGVKYTLVYSDFNNEIGRAHV